LYASNCKEVKSNGCGGFCVVCVFLIELIDSVFLLQIIASFAIGGAVVSAFIAVGERLDAKKAGLFIGLPITSAVGLFFIGLTQSAQAAADAATIMPITLGIGLLFLFIFLQMRERVGTVISIAISTSVFCILSAIFVYFQFTNILINGAIYIAITAISYLLVRTFPEKRAAFHAGKSEIAVRAVFAGLIIAGAVIAAKTFGSQWGGILAAFPATYIATMFIATERHNIDFAKSIVKGAPIGTTGSMAYYLAVNVLYPAYGILIGTIISYAVAVLTVVVILKLLPKN